MTPQKRGWNSVLFFVVSVPTKIATWPKPLGQFDSSFQTCSTSKKLQNYCRWVVMPWAASTRVYYLLMSVSWRWLDTNWSWYWLAEAAVHCNYKNWWDIPILAGKLCLLAKFMILIIMLFITKLATGYHNRKAVFAPNPKERWMLISTQFHLNLFFASCSQHWEA